MLLKISQSIRVASLGQLIHKINNLTKFLDLFYALSSLIWILLIVSWIEILNWKNCGILMRPLNNITDKFTNVTSAQKKIHLLYFVGISICEYNIWPIEKLYIIQSMIFFHCRYFSWSIWHIIDKKKLYTIPSMIEQWKWYLQ
jgi:hypothetical protein